MKRQDYFPTTIGEQVLWLAHFANTLPAVAASVQFPAHEVDDAVADARWLVYVLGSWRTELRRIAPAGTAAVEHAMTGRGLEPLQLPVYEIPALPDGVVPVKPGALTRLFRTVVQLKHSPGYTEGLGRMLGVLPRRDSGAHPTPTCKIKLRQGPKNQHPVIRYSRHGHDGVLIQSRAPGGEWQDLAIGMNAVYEDTRPLRTPGQPELREYRLCFWKCKPYGDWSAVATVTVSA